MEASRQQGKSWGPCPAHHLLWESQESPNRRQLARAPAAPGTMARTQMSNGRMQLQRAGCVLRLHHAQTPEEQPGPWEALPSPPICLRLGRSLTRLEGSPVQEQHRGHCRALPWLSSSNNTPCPVSPHHPQYLCTSNSDQCRAEATSLAPPIPPPGQSATVPVGDTASRPASHLSYCSSKLWDEN